MMDLLTKTGPISGAVWARGMQRFELDADAFSSLQADRNKAGVSSFPSLRALLNQHNMRCKVESRRRTGGEQDDLPGAVSLIPQAAVGIREKRLITSASVPTGSVCNLVTDAGWTLARSHDTAETRHERAHDSCLTAQLLKLNSDRFLKRMVERRGDGKPSGVTRVRVSGQEII